MFIPIMRHWLFSFILILSVQLHSQTNLVINPGFEEYTYFETELTTIPLDAATGWKGFRTPDLYLREGLDKNGNIVKIAPYLNECIIGSLKYPTQKNTIYKFSIDVFSFKARRHKNLLQICLFENYDEDIVVPEQFTNCVDIPIKKIKKGWQTLRLEFSALEGRNEILIGNIKSLNEKFRLYLDNVKLIAPAEKPVGTIQLESD